MAAEYLTSDQGSSHTLSSSGRAVQIPLSGVGATHNRPLKRIQLAPDAMLDSLEGPVAQIAGPTVRLAPAQPIAGTAEDTAEFDRLCDKVLDATGVQLGSQGRLAVRQAR